MKTFKEFREYLGTCSDNVVLLNANRQNNLTTSYGWSRAYLGDILFHVNSGYNVQAVRDKLDELATALVLGELTIQENN